MQAAQRDGGRPAARAGRHANGGRWRQRRDSAVCSGMPASSVPRIATTSSSSPPSRPASATSGTSAAPGGRASSSARARTSQRVTVGAGYTFLRATFESDETVNGESNSTNDAAEEGEPGLEGAIEIETWRSDAADPAPPVQGICRRAGYEPAGTGRQPDRQQRASTRAATRTICTSPTARTTSVTERPTAMPCSTSARATR